MHYNIVLVEPEIPQNTGNIARTCACTNSSLHLVKPMGFEIDDRKLKRAGLDYWHDLDIHYYDSIYDFLEQHKDDVMLFASTKSEKIYSDAQYPDNCYILFGKETRGLPETLLKANYDKCIRIPMAENYRSLNLSNSVAIVIYEALRQHGFENLETKGELTGRNESQSFD